MEQFIIYATGAIDLMSIGSTAMCLPEVQKITEEAYKKLTPEEKKLVVRIWSKYLVLKIIDLFGGD